jgi:penicillin-binding protein 1C
MIETGIFGKKAAVIIGILLLTAYIFCLPEPLFDKPYSTHVSDRSGELLGARIAADGQWRFPQPDSIPEKYKICLIQYEDHHFYRHPGVNPLAIARAVKQNLQVKRVVSGGSTITMQTIRLMRQNKRTYFEKLIEIILATRLELVHSKDEILVLYGSHAPMGGNVVGIDAASWRYFGHPAASLSWAEAATLAVLPNSPSLMHFGRNREGLINKRNRLLKKLHDKKIISQTDYTLAIAEPLPTQPHALPQVAPHLVTRLYLTRPGAHVRSTINKQLQQQADDVLARWNAEFSQNGIFNMAALIVDIEKNEVLTYSGNVDFHKKAGNQVDVIQSPRSTGSILKPFLYCAMLQEGLLLPNEILPDIPVNINNFAPKNFSLQYDGAVAADEALARSLNVPWVIALREYSVPKFHQLLKSMGMTTLNKPSDYYGLSLILGGAEGTLWEVANGYAHIARTVNDYGQSQDYVEKTDFSFLKTENKPKRKATSSPLFDPGAAWLTLEALTNVNRPEEMDWQFIPSIRKVAWKTGTSYGFRDGWAIGVTPTYLVAVWTGNASGEGRPGLTGARTSAQVMFDLFNLLPPTSWFQTPYGELREAVVCRESGCLKGIHCPETSVDIVLVPGKGLQGKVCDFHRQIHVSADERFQVYEQCAGKRGLKTVTRFVLPPSWEWYYKQHHPAYRSLPPYSPECLNGASGQIMQFIYPYPNAIIKITKQLDGSRGKAVFELAHRNSSARVFWHLDDSYIGETADIHQMELSPGKGVHTLTVVDEAGHSIGIRFSIE